jgi:hypothetical protein
MIRIGTESTHKSIVIATRLHTTQSGVQIPVGAKRFLFSRLTLGSNQPPIQWEPPFYPMVKQMGYEFNNSSPSSAKVKNEWSCTSAPPISLHGMDRENFIFYYIMAEICILLLELNFL